MRETVVLRWWGSETLKFGIKQVDDRGSNFHHEKIVKLMFQALALH